MLRVTIKSTEVTTKSGTNSRGKWEIHEQQGWIELNDERRKLSISLKDKDKPYRPGEYSVDDASFFVNQFGGLEIGRLVLTVIAAAKVA